MVQFQYILQSVQADELSSWANKLVDRMRADPAFRDVTTDAQLRGLQAQLNIDRDRANAMGVSMDAVRGALFSASGRHRSNGGSSALLERPTSASSPRTDR